MRKILALLVLVLLVATTGIAQAGFMNGDFEQGTFNGWTLGGNTGDSAIVTAGADSNTNNALQRVIQGTYSARVGDQFGGSHSSTIYQTVANWQDSTIWFSWAAVLQEPANGITHSVSAMPDYSVTLFDVTKNLTLYSQAFNVTNIPSSGWHQGATNSVAGDRGVWNYSDWYAMSLDTSTVLGDTLKLTFTATDCGLGAHGGYMYVDQVGSTPPIIPSVPEPASLLLLGFGLVGLATLRKSKK